MYSHLAKDPAGQASNIWEIEGEFRGESENLQIWWCSGGHRDSLLYGCGLRWNDRTEKKQVRNESKDLDGLDMETQREHILSNLTLLKFCLTFWNDFECQQYCITDVCSGNCRPVHFAKGWIWGRRDIKHTRNRKPMKLMRWRTKCSSKSQVSFRYLKAKEQTHRKELTQGLRSRKWNCRKVQG